MITTMIQTILTNNHSPQNYQNHHYLIIPSTKYKVIQNLYNLTVKLNLITSIKQNTWIQMLQDTKFSYKTVQERFGNNSWLNNSKMKFETKEGKTKLSISKKMFDGGIRQQRNFKKKDNIEQNNQNQQNYRDNGNGRQSKQKGEIEQSIKSKLKKNESEIQKLPQQKKSKDKDSNDLDLSFSTAYDNSKLNIRIKDRGQFQFKFNQTIDLILNELKAQFQYLFQHTSKKEEINKYSVELLYTTGLRRWIQQILPPQIHFEQKHQVVKFQQVKQVEIHPIQKRLVYHKNQTKVKSKISSHNDTEIKLNSINHFGSIHQKTKNQNTTTVIQALIPQAKLINPQKLEQIQKLQTKLELQTKLTLPQKQIDQFNLKSFLHIQSVSKRQLFKIETIVNQYGLHNVETKYLCKSLSSIIFGGMIGFNWNSHSSEWHRKWELIFQKQGFYKRGNLILSVGDKCAGVKFIKRFGQNYKLQFMLSRKWNTGNNIWPSFGAKININW